MRRVQMQDIRKTFKLRDQKLKTIVYVCVAISKPYGAANQKSTIDTHKKKKKSKHNIKVSSNHRNGKKKKGMEKKRSTKTKPKQFLKMAIRTHISIIILNANGLNSSIKRHRLAEWI